jgi:hypothetical protein
MDRLTAEFLHNFAYVIFLKESNRGNPGGSRFETRLSVGECNSAKGQHRDIRLARFAELHKTCGLRTA